MAAEATLNEDVPLEAIRALLVEVFDGQRFTAPYLDWLYRANPCGTEISANLTHGDRCLAHYAAIPQAWHGPDGEHAFALALNVAVAAEARGRGLFLSLAEQTFQRAAATRGATAIIGVGNASTALAYPRHLGFQLVAPLPVRLGVVLPRRVTSVREVAVGDIPAHLLASDPGQWRQAWTHQRLAWRLASPMMSYRIHLHDGAAMVSCRVMQSGLPVTAVVKVFAAPGGQAAIGGLLAAAAHAHKTPVYVYAGFNDRVRVPGLPLPRRLLPSPLHLVYRPMSPSAPATFRPAAFEFLDFDAY